MEYAAELWTGEISEKLKDNIEVVQTRFARAVLGLDQGWNTANDIVRAELGLEMLAARREKLRLGYWRRIQVARKSRALHYVAALRRRQLLDWNSTEGWNSWLRGTRRLLRHRELGEFWENPGDTEDISKEGWRRLVYDKVEEGFERDREQRMKCKGSIGRYREVRNWERVGEERAVFKGEIGRFGALVPERYLDDTKENMGFKLNLLCRANRLPLMGAIMREVGCMSDV